MEPLTKRQQKVLEYLESRLETAGPPSQREVAAHFGLAQNAVHQMVLRLRKKGYLVDVGGHRGLRLSPEYAKLRDVARGRGLAVLGRVAAGEPILAEENVEEVLDLNEMFVREGETFMVRVVGESMVDEGIMEGDLVVVERKDKVESGRMAVVELEGEVTVKRVFLRAEGMELRPANERGGYRSRVVAAGTDGVRVVGQVVGCLRRVD